MSVRNESRRAGEDDRGKEQALEGAHNNIVSSDARPAVHGSAATPGGGQWVPCMRRSHARMAGEVGPASPHWHTSAANIGAPIPVHIGRGDDVERCAAARDRGTQQDPGSLLLERQLSLARDELATPWSIGSTAT